MYNLEILLVVEFKHGCLSIYTSDKKLRQIMVLGIWYVKSFTHNILQHNILFLVLFCSSNMKTSIGTTNYDKSLLIRRQLASKKLLIQGSPNVVFRVFHFQQHYWQKWVATILSYHLLFKINMEIRTTFFTARRMKKMLAAKKRLLKRLHVKN